MTFINYSLIDEKVQDWKKEFQFNAPFPHLKIDGLLRSTRVDEMITHFPRENSPYIHASRFYNVKGHSTLGRHVPELYQHFFDEVTDPLFVRALEKITGIKGLKADKLMQGGGLELGLPGAFSLLHTDPFQHYHHKKWFSAVTVLFYLSDPWKEEYNGELELWDIKKKMKMQSFSPQKNRCLIFQNSTQAYHGYPTPLAQPKGIYRRSILLWYYTENSQERFRPIKYHVVEKNWRKKILASLENKLIWIYTFLRLYFKFNNQLALKMSRWLRPQG